MRTNQTTPRTIDEYIAGFPDEVQEILQKIRMTIHQAAPGAEEKISYQMPAFTLNGADLLAFSAWKKHVGLYPAPRGSEGFKAELSAYKGGKGTVQLPFDQPIPLGLIKRIVKFRIKKNRERAEARAKKQASAKAKRGNKTK
jgi:uncharacterized protein YdhG (YjbR/CyaY superfamily)